MIKKVKKTHLEVVVLVLLYLGMMWLWTIPIRNNPIPYGEPDAAIHYLISDNIYSTNKISLYEPRASAALAPTSFKFGGAKSKYSLYPWLTIIKILVFISFIIKILEFITPYVNRFAFPKINY